ncbi:hypothetical protein BLNAU_12330 [Blattamonas nauphoetae]|uniref:Uncharacterized protein n=1 Tax=Blattamonas nauphoetae TaxID=2049346 RepID=A0ABQ9XKY5_9EUKA|nr:hypothetical protein BLNAU_12330 [Blattamonas nauphoetae]
MKEELKFCFKIPNHYLLALHLKRDDERMNATHRRLSQERHSERVSEGRATDGHNRRETESLLMNTCRGTADSKRVRALIFLRHHFLFTCLVNTHSALWRLKYTDDKVHLNKEEMWKNNEQELETEGAAHKLTLADQTQDQEKTMRTEDRIGQAEGETGQIGIRKTCN